MAVTSIWRVKGWLGKVVVYVENPDKTTNPAYYEKEDMTDRECQELGDVIAYAINSDKTQQIDTEDEIVERFVSGVNCHPATARMEMMAIKKRFGKEDGTVAYHGYQSFAPGEATPEIAHRIGVQLAQRLWGDRYQVVVATHLDKENHLHNHFGKTGSGTKGGSGRDSAFFSSLGFAVTALDGSEELCKLAKKNHGIDALCIRFEDLSFQAEFDGIWACASLLHIRKAHMSDILSKVSAALKPGGILYASFKYGTGEHFHNGRFFNNYTEADLPTLLTPETRLTLLEYRITGDVRPECAGQRWLSFLAKKQTEV